MIDVVKRVTCRRCRRRGQIVRLVVAVVAVSVLIAVFLHVRIITRIRTLLVRHKLLKLAGDRRLLTFFSTPYWGIGNAMFAFSSTLATARADSDHLPPLLCFDAHLPVRDAFPLLADWPECNPNDVLELLDVEKRHEKAYAM